MSQTQVLQLQSEHFEVPGPEHGEEEDVSEFDKEIREVGAHLDEALRQVLDPE